MNHNTQIRKFSLMMALLLVAGSASTLLSCGGDEPAADDGKTTNAPIVTEAVTEDPGPKLELPEADYGGRNFNMLIPTEYTDHYVAESETGDVVLDAIYKRNRAVEELLNIKYNYIPESGGWESRDAFKGIIRNSVLAGDGAYDLIAGYQVVTLPLTLEGVFMDINEVPNIDLEKPWWVHNLVDTIGIEGKLYTVIGDASISLYSEIPVLYFNKKLLADYNLPDPYPMVTEGTWTLDALFDLVKDAHSDINGDGKLVFGEDHFGYTAVAVAQRAFQTAAEFTVFDYDDNGMPCFVDLSERDAELYFKMGEFIKSPGVHAYGVTNTTEYITPFLSDQVLISNGFISHTNLLRDMKSDFGILPLPKRDEAQENYHSQVGTAAAMFFVPATVPDAAMTGMTAEAMNYYSYKEVIPAYFEIALKEKYTRDEGVKQMLDIVRENAQVNFTFAFSTVFDPFTNCILPTSSSEGVTNDIASKYEKNVKRWERTLGSLLESYNEIGS
ncbi:MAG: carbohydrate ABC transporter substrate-binding protein [Ruminococcaceae bacterium]|nr:carbohydrate ABC transporter substrate-binding protein [Oscillospiraceae bacterium]